MDPAYELERLKEYQFHLAQAEMHAERALDLLYEDGGPRRNLWIRLRLGRAQSILIQLYKKDIQKGI